MHCMPCHVEALMCACHAMPCSSTFRLKPQMERSPSNDHFMPCHTMACHPMPGHAAAGLVHAVVWIWRSPHAMPCQPRHALSC